MEMLQIIPILFLIGYFFYLFYYYVVPMMHLRLLLAFAYKVRKCTEVRFTEEQIIIRVQKDREELVLERPLGVDLMSRHFVITACSVLKGMLAEIKTTVKI